MSSEGRTADFLMCTILLEVSRMLRMEWGACRAGPVSNRTGRCGASQRRTRPAPSAAAKIGSVS